MVEPGGIVSSPDGRLWFVLGVDDEKVVLRRLDDNKVMLSLLRGGQRIEISWKEWATGWELADAVAWREEGCKRRRCGDHQTQQIEVCRRLPMLAKALLASA